MRSFIGFSIFIAIFAVAIIAYCRGYESGAIDGQTQSISLIGLLKEAGK